MKLTLVLFSIVAFLGVSNAFAQDGSVGTEHQAVITAPNAIYLEILGSGLVPSINYDRMIGNSFAVRVGVGYLPLGTVVSDSADGPISASITTVPVGLSWFPFSGPNSAPASKLEIGVSAFYANVVAKSFSNTAAGSGIGFGGILGYRLEPSDGGFLLRVALTPWDLLNHFQMYGGISLGWCF